MFIDIPEAAGRWFLDTNVWGTIAGTDALMERFVSAIRDTNNLACLTVYSLFELSRATHLLPSLDHLFFQIRHNVWIPLLYDFLYEAELAAYPHRASMKWMPISLLTGEDKNGPSVMTKFAQNDLFVGARNDHLQFAHGEFMSLEKFKFNFPVKDSGAYTAQDALLFARLNGIDYFIRHDPEFLKRIPGQVRGFDPEGIPSQFARSIYLFFKYYVHGKTPNKSDFMDFANISYLPYLDLYITERDALNTIKHIKGSTEFMQTVSPLHISDFLNMIP